MTIIDDYRYDLHLEGADEQTLTQFLQAFEGSDFHYLMAQDPDEPFLLSSEMVDGTGKMFEYEVEEELHALALQFPKLKLHLVAENLDRQDYGYELICQGDLFQRADLISSLSDFSPPVPFAERQSAIQQEHIRAQKKDELLKEICTKTDFDLLHAGKEALESALQHDARLPKEALHDLIGFLNTMTDFGEVLGRFQKTGSAPEFPLQPDYQKRDVHYPAHTNTEQTAQSLYMLSEEMENDNGFREFTVLALSQDQAGLQKLMQAKIEKDEYGYIAESGTLHSNGNYFSSNFESGFVSYSITEQKLLDHSEIEQLLTTKEYDPVFRGPENLRTAVLQAIEQCAAENSYYGVHISPVADTLLADKGFHSHLIRNGWFSEEAIPDYRMPIAVRDCVSYLEAVLEGDPDYFVTAGGLTPISYPDNLREILMDNVYVVARDHHLPIKDPDGIINKILLDPAFQSICRKEYDVSHLAEGSDQYQTAVWSCYDFVQNIMLPDHPKKEHAPFEEQLKHAEKKRVQQLSSKTKQPTPQKTDIDIAPSL